MESPGDRAEQTVVEGVEVVLVGEVGMVEIQGGDL